MVEEDIWTILFGQKGAVAALVGCRNCCSSTKALLHRFDSVNSTKWSYSLESVGAVVPFQAGRASLSLLSSG